MFIWKIFWHFWTSLGKGWDIIKKDMINSTFARLIIFFVDIINYLLSFIVVFIARLHRINKLNRRIIWCVKCLLKRLFLFVFVINFNCNWKNIFKILSSFILAILKLYVWMIIKFELIILRNNSVFCLFLFLFRLFSYLLNQITPIWIWFLNYFIAFWIKFDFVCNRFTF